MNPSLRSRSFHKLHHLKEELLELQKSDFTVPFIAITESWLKEHITDAQINIVDYNIFRSDRKLSRNGGALLYIHRKIIIDNFETFDNNSCNGIVCLSRNSGCIIACIYRPPNSGNDSFSQLLDYLNSFISIHNSQNRYQLFLFGDFNLPQINWNSLTLNKVDQSADLCYNLLNFMDKHFLTQYVNEKTRINNILDLFLTDNPNFVQHIKVKDISFSDHSLIKIYTTFFHTLNSTSHKKLNSDPELTNEPDFSIFNLNSSDFVKINAELCKINWHDIVSPLQDFPVKFRNIIHKVLQNYFNLIVKYHPITETHFKKTGTV